MPGKTGLRTDWVKVGTSGKTVDGREIQPTQIEQMASSYDPEEYTAVINYEHYRWAGNFGAVLELKAEENKAGDMCLFAVLEPNKYMLSMNADGQKMFTSMEIFPDYAGTGEAYLGGLALTDSPASRGTTQIKFSSKVSVEQISGDPEEFNFSLESGEDQPPGWFTAFMKHFKKPASEEATDPDEGEDMNKEQMAAFTASVTKSVEETIDAKLKAFKKELNASNDGEGEDAAPDQSAPEAAVFSTEDGQKLVDTVTKLSEKVDAVTEKLNTAINTESGKNTPESKGGEDAERVL